MGPPVLTIDAVSVAFAAGQRPALDGASLSLPRGRLLGLLGPNGSGKSTLLRVAAGLLSPHQGAVRLDGRPLASLRRGEIARRIAFVPQGAVVPEAFTGWDVALAGRTPHLRPLRGPSPADEAVARRALDLVDATHLADRRAGEMSGGERQRLLLARAIAQEPAALLLDEPTTHLDLPHQLAILDLTLRLVESGDLAALAVFHDLNLAAEYCDQIALLHEGRILVHGTPHEVLTPDWIARVYGIDVAVVPHPESGRPVVFLPPARTDARIDTSLPARRPDTGVAASLLTREALAR
jgi:iron complex transport system ATP-binding protein